MNTIDQIKPILVTGGAGYLASWIIKLLFDNGLELRICAVAKQWNS
jgi:nucleoside-diphosphate-sugar epimerase